ncbi:MAG: hypothetical protein HFJ50_07060 [Clostridia bacterium]|jgi:hypothetical protein|nr:hypothetical protein [Clostridia bacterium]
MYSFARLRKYNFFIAGFVHEKIDEGTFKRFKNTKTKVYRFKVTDEQYKNIKSTVDKVWEKRKKYKFNILGLCAVSIHKKVKREYYFYCAEFVKYVLEKANIKTDLPDIVKPDDFKNIEGLEEIYSGYLRDYSIDKIIQKEILTINT